MHFAKLGTLVLLPLLVSSHERLYAQAAQPTEASQAKQLPPEVLFAQRYVRVLRDSGAAGVVSKTVPKTRALKGYAPNMDALRDDLSPEGTTVTIDRWSAVPAKGAAPALFLVVFKVEGIARPVELSLYVEELDGQYMLNSIMTKALVPKGDRT